MNINLKKKRSLFAIAFLCLVVLVGITIAYFTSTSNIENIFNAGTYKTVTTEVFTSPSNWAPGDETPKTITTKNEGTIPVRVRVKLEESWTSKNEDDLPLQYNDENVAIINLDNELDWIKNGDYYYYTKELAPRESTTSLLKSVTFNSSIPSDVTCSNTGGVYTCESTGDGYDGAQYKLNITTETVQASKYEEVWENVPIMYDYVGDNPCTFNGELVPGAEYVNGQYTYSYRKEYYINRWIDSEDDGWGVRLTDKNSTDPVTTNLCSSINNKPIVSMQSMFLYSKATTINLSSFDTSNVTNMSNMFFHSDATSIDVSSFDTSRVTNMEYMFMSTNNITSLDLRSFDTSNVRTMKYMFGSSNISSIDLSSFDTGNVTNMFAMFDNCKLTSLNVSNFNTSSLKNMGAMFARTIFTELNISNFDTSNVTNMFAVFSESQVLELDLSGFNTSKVTDMRQMFRDSHVTSLDLSSFDTSHVTDMSDIFKNAVATTGYARTQADADRFNASSYKPSTLTFMVKTS